MHKVRGCLTALLAIVVLYFSWVAYPPSKYEAISKEILQRSAERFQAEQKLAGNGAVNGYVDPVFRPYWGRRGMEYQKSFPLRARLKALEPYCDLLNDHDVGLESQKGPAVAALFEDFAKVYASFHENCNKPNFIVPENHLPNATNILPSVGAMRYLAFYNSAYAEYLMVRGWPGQSLTVTADSIRFGSRLSRQQSLPVYLMISFEMQSIGQNTLAMTLETAPIKKLGPELESVSKMLPAPLAGTLTQRSGQRTFSSRLQPDRHPGGPRSKTDRLHRPARQSNAPEDEALSRRSPSRESQHRPGLEGVATADGHGLGSAWPPLVSLAGLGNLRRHPPRQAIMPLKTRIDPIDPMFARS